MNLRMAPQAPGLTACPPFAAIATNMHFVVRLPRRQKIVLAALASQPGAEFAPVQIQKFFFLLDTNIAADLGGQLFAFKPYDYVPFDAAVYSELENLRSRGYVVIDDVPTAGRRSYSLTTAGQEMGSRFLAELPVRASGYMAAVSDWVRKLSFGALVGSIYKQYPAMRANSVFRD